MRDKIDAAIERTIDEPTIAMIHIPVMISTTQRPASIDIPADCTEAELLELVGFIAANVRIHLRDDRASKASRLVVPGRILA